MICIFNNCFLNFDRDKFNFKTKFICHYCHCFCIEPLIDRNE